MRRRQLFIDLRARALAMFRRRALRRRLGEEIRFHLEMREQRLVEAGLDPAQAHIEARKHFGNPSVVAETTLEMWRYGAMDRLLQDVRYALRTLARAPGFTAIAVLSLALGIGANAAIFTLIDRVLLRLLPVEDPRSLVIVPGGFSYPRYEYFRDHTRDAFTGVMGVANVSRIGVDGSEDEAGFVEGRLVSGTYFEVLGVRPLLGRLIGSEDDRVPGGHPVAVISHAFWQRYFRGDPAVVGRTIRLSAGTLSSGSGTGGFEEHKESGGAVPGGRFAIVGVTQAGFFGETVGQHPDFWTPLNQSLIRERTIAKLSVLFGILAVVLASVGLYGVLAYAVVRRTNEIGIRMAIGAQRRDIIWMIVRETFALVVAGIIAGVPIALGLSRYIESLLYGLKPNDAMTISGVVLLMFGIALAAAVAPARRAVGIDPIRALRYE